MLAGIIHQNPSIHVSGTSGILGMLANIRNFWDDVSEFKALDHGVSSFRKLSVMKGALEGFYADVGRDIIIDKCRGWPQHLELAESILGYKPKVIVTVRDIRDVLASFERLWRLRKQENFQIDQEKHDLVSYQSLDGRCKSLMGVGGIVGSAANLICDAVVRGWRQSLHFVEYDNLCSRPHDVLAGIYEFLELEACPHDLNNIVSSVVENDEAYGWGKLHDVRPKISTAEPQWPKYLTTSVAMQYSQDARFWEKL